MPFVLSWSVIEAMSVGLPIVASDTPPVKEVITHMESGILVDFFDLSAQADAVIQIDDSDLRLTPVRALFLVAIWFAKIFDSWHLSLASNGFSSEFPTKRHSVLGFVPISSYKYAADLPMSSTRCPQGGVGEEHTPTTF